MKSSIRSNAWTTEYTNNGGSFRYSAWKSYGLFFRKKADRLKSFQSIYNLISYSKSWSSWLHTCRNSTLAKETTALRINVNETYKNKHSHGSRDSVEGVPTKITSIRLPSLAIFFLTYFYRDRVPWPPTSRALTYDWSITSFIMVVNDCPWETFFSRSLNRNFWLNF